jgi:hypothetical protein
LAKSNVVVAMLHVLMCIQIPQLNPNLALFDQFVGIKQIKTKTKLFVDNEV